MSNISKRGYIGATNYRALNHKIIAVIRCDYSSTGMFTKGDFYVGFKGQDVEHQSGWWVVDDNRHLRCIDPDDRHSSFGSFTLHSERENDLPALDYWGEDQLIDPIVEKSQVFPSTH